MRGLLATLTVLSAGRTLAQFPDLVGEAGFLPIYAESPVREGRPGCGVTLTCMLPTDPISTELGAENPPDLALVWKKDGTVIASLTPTAEGSQEWSGYTERPEKYESELHKVCTANDIDNGYHHMNVYTHYARLSIKDIGNSDAGTYTCEAAFNGIIGSDFTDVVIPSGKVACPGFSRRNFGYGDLASEGSALLDETVWGTDSGICVGTTDGANTVSVKNENTAKAGMVMYGPFAARPNERWVVENVVVNNPSSEACSPCPEQLKESGDPVTTCQCSCAGDRFCKEGLEVRVYDITDEVAPTGTDDLGRPTGGQASATLDQRSYYLPYGTGDDDYSTYNLITPYAKQPLTLRAGQYLALQMKVIGKARGERRRLVKTANTYNAGFCATNDAFYASNSACVDAGFVWVPQVNKWYYNDDEFVTSPIPDSINAAKSLFTSIPFQTGTTVPVKLLDATERGGAFDGHGGFSFKAKTVFYQTWYPEELETKIIYRPRQEQDNSGLLMILLIVIGVAVCCCCVCCAIYGRQSKRLRERRIFMSSMLGQSFNVSSETGEPLPPNWYEEKTANGDIYYYNPTTQESMWDIPTFG